MKKLTILIFSALLAYADSVYSVDELILKALDNSPNLKMSLAKYRASKSRVDAQKGSYLPLVNLRLSAGKYGQNNSLIYGEKMVDDDLLLGNLSLKQIIYDFGKTGGSVDSATYNSQAYDLLNKQNISDKIRDVKYTYYDVLKALALIEVHKENVKLNKAQLYRSKKYFKAGIRTKIDISDARVELIKSQLDLNKAQYNLQLAYASLDRVVCSNHKDANYSVYFQELDFTNMYSSLSEYKLNLKDSIEYAYANRDQLKKYMADIKVAQANATQIDSDYYPEIYLNADYTKQKVDKFKSFIPKNQWQATINVDWNIYRGGSTKAQAREKKIEIEIAKAKLQDEKLSINKEVTEAYINVYKAKDTVKLSQSLVEVSNEKFKQASKRYEQGLSDYIELQQSRQSYIDSMASLVINYYKYYQEVAYLDNAIGK